MNVLLRLDRLARMSPTWLSPDLYERRRRWLALAVGLPLALAMLFGTALALGLG